MMINSGIDEGVRGLQQSLQHRRCNVLDEMVNTDLANGQSFGIGG